VIDLLQLDRTVFDRINADWSSSILDAMMPSISHLGDAAIVWLWIALVALLMMRQLARSDSTAQGSGQHRTITKAVAFFCLYMALIYGVNAGVYNGLKQLFHRSRPFVQQTVMLRVSSKTALSLRHDSSFPSGHACNAFMVAAFLAQRFRRKRYGLYGLATLVALSRIYLGVHYPSDVLVGAGLGLSITWLVLSFRPLRNRMTRESLFGSQD
jgi:undecaprenyl-diphosphatase